MRVSIALKILSIAIIVVIAMTVVSLVNLLTARSVSSGIERITSGYLSVYGAVARVNIYSTEEAYRTRRYVIEKAFGMRYEGGDAEGTLARLKSLDVLVRENLEAAHHKVAIDLSNDDFPGDDVMLARIEERLNRIANEENTHLARQEKLIGELDRGETAQFREDYDDLVKWRAEYDLYMEETRKLVFAAANDAGREVAHHQARATQFSVALLTLAGILAIGMALILTRQLVRPLKELLAGVRAIASGRLEVHVPVKTGDEVGRLTEAFNQMTEELRVGSRARDLFGRYVDSRIARQLIEVPQTFGQEGERRTMTVLFCDLQGFTRISEQMTPRGLVTVMNRYFTLMSEVVHAHQGVIDKFIGDAVMAYWGAPFSAEGDQGKLAALSAMAQVERMARLEAELPDLLNMKRGLPSVNLRVGIATGEVVVGSIGSDAMRNYTVMGDAVNLASRLEGVNKLYGTHILLAEETARYVGDDLELREIDSLIVMGQSQPTRIFEVLSRSGALSADLLAARDAYGQGLAFYRNQDWDAAQSAFERVLGLLPGDAPARLFLGRIEKLRRDPPGAGWNGVWVMESK